MSDTYHASVRRWTGREWETAYGLDARGNRTALAQRGLTREEAERAARLWTGVMRGTGSPTPLDCRADVLPDEE